MYTSPGKAIAMEISTPPESRRDVGGPRGGINVLAVSEAGPDAKETRSTPESHGIATPGDVGGADSVSEAQVANSHTTHTMEERITKEEEQAENDSYVTMTFSDRIEKLELANKVAIGRIVQQERIIESQQRQITDLRSRSMRDNVIIRTKGAAYKEVKNENTTQKITEFVRNELKLADSDKIHITRAHRMGQRFEDRNKPMIAKVLNSYDQKRLFQAAPVLEGTGFSITKQIPAEIEERKQLAWPTYKRARADGKYARFEPDGALVSGGCTAGGGASLRLLGPSSSVN